MRCKGRPFCGVIYTIKERCFLSGVVPQWWVLIFLFSFHFSMTFSYCRSLASQLTILQVCSCLLTQGGVQLVFALRESRGTLGWALILVWPTEVIVQKDLQLSLWSPAWWRNNGCLRLDEQIHYMHAQTMGECGRMAWRDDRPTRHNKMFSLRICR
jgi:hypothetical protein